MSFFLKTSELIANSIALFSSKLGEKSRIVMMNVAIFVLLWNGVARYCNGYIQDYLYYQQAKNVSIVFLLILLVASIDERIDTKNIQINKLFLVGWILCFGGMLINSAINTVVPEYLIWSLISIFVFPVLFLAWSCNRNYFTICKIAAYNTVTLSYVFFICSLVLNPFFTKNNVIATPNYLGIVQNPNNNGIVCTAFFGAALFMMLVDSKRRIPYLISMGVSIGISVISVARTAELAILMELIVGIAYYLKGSKRGDFRKIQPKHAVACIFIVILFALISGFGFKMIDDIDLEVHAESVTTTAAQEDEQSIEEKLNSISSGRIGIWKAYIKETSFFGNGSPDEPVIEGFHASIWAHNNALDILYISGVVPFLGYIIWIAFSLIYIARKLLSIMSRIKWETLFAIIMFMGYFIQAMLEITIYPFDTNITLLAYVGVAIIMFEEKERIVII